MSPGGHLRVRPVDPRDTTWEVDTPAYRVYFWSLPPGPPPSSSEEGIGWSSDEYEVEDADVTVVLEWPTPRHPLARSSRCTRWSTATARPASSGSLVPTQRHRAVMSDSCCQQTVSNRASRSPATHIQAIEVSLAYLRRRAVEAGRARGW